MESKSPYLINYTFFEHSLRKRPKTQQPRVIPSQKFSKGEKTEGSSNRSPPKVSSLSKNKDEDLRIRYETSPNESKNYYKNLYFFIKNWIE